MRRRHREIAGGEVAMMAVITKAMGAFLVLMILLLPYYTGDTKSQQTVDETKQRIDEAKAGLDGAVDKLKKGRLTDAEIDDLLKSLMLARDELVEAQNLIAQLRIKIDQMASQINRLDQQNAALQTQVAKLQGEVETLLAKIKEIEKKLEEINAENVALKASVAELTSKVSTLEAANASLTQANADLKAAIERLKAEIERLKAFDPAVLQARIKELEKQVEMLNADNAALIATVADLNTKLGVLQTANNALAQQNALLSAENEELRKRAVSNPASYVVSECSDPTLEVDLKIYDGTKSDDAYDATLVSNLMPWSRPPPPPAFDTGLQSSEKKLNISYSSVKISERTFSRDVFLSLNTGDVLTKFYSGEEKVNAKDPSGQITSRESLTSCQATFFIEWKGKVIQFGTFQIGLIEPLIFVKHLVFVTDEGKIYEANDQRPQIPKLIADATCSRFKPFCTLAQRQAEARMRNQVLGLRNSNSSAAKSNGPPPPPTADKTINSSP